MGATPQVRGLGSATLPRWGSRVRIPSSALEEPQVRAGGSRPFFLLGTAESARGRVGVPSRTSSRIRRPGPFDNRPPRGSAGGPALRRVGHRWTRAGKGHVAGRSVRAQDASKPLSHPNHDEYGASRDEDEGRGPDRQPHSDRKQATDEPAPGNAHCPTIAFVRLAEWSSKLSRPLGTFP